MTRSRFPLPIALVALVACAACTHAANAATRARTRATAPHRAAAATLAAPKPSRALPAGGPRTLDAIHIEGEIPVPQVLFITAREQRRFLEFQHARYRRTAAQLAAASPAWDRIVVDPSPITPAQESPR